MFPLKKFVKKKIYILTISHISRLSRFFPSASNIFFSEYFAVILVLRIPGEYTRAHPAPSGRDEWMAAITGVDKHIKPPLSLPTSKRGRSESISSRSRQHRGGQDLFGFFGFNLCIRGPEIHRYNLLYIRPLSVVEPIVPCQINAFVILRSL